MSKENDLQDKLIEIEKYILDPTRNPELVAEKIRLDKLSKRRKAYREKKLKAASLKSDSEDVLKNKKITPRSKNKKITPKNKKNTHKPKNKKITPNSDNKLKTKKKSNN